MSLEAKIHNFLLSLEKTESNLFSYLGNKAGEFNSEKDSVYYSGPYWDSLEVEAAIKSLLEGKWLTSGEKVNQFERKFSKVFGFQNSLMVNSGSSANLVMIAALKKFHGWEDGDEIIVSVVGFPTTVSAIIQNGLKPVFVDITWRDLNWDLDLIQEKITPRTRAIFSSPVLGNPYDFDRALDICRTNDLIHISDNCDSLGSTWRDKYLTSYSQASSCSFYPAHHITTMEGGMVSSDIEEIITIARSISWWGRGCYCVGVQNLLPNGVCKKRFSNWIDECDFKLDHKYLFENVGYNLKPLDLQGAIGLVQLEKFKSMEEMRRKNKLFLDEVFARIPGTDTLVELPYAKTSWFGKPIICETTELKSRLVAHLEAERIQTRNYFAGNILLHPAYRPYGDWREFPNANEVLSKVFFVGVSPTISGNMLKHIEVSVERFNNA